MKHIVVTGASKGLGEALAYEAIKNDYTVHCISRTINEGLAEHDSVHYYPFDLLNLEEIPSLMKDIYKHLKSCEEVFIIQNAGIIGPIKKIEDCHPNELFQNNLINLMAPMLFTSEFIKRSKNLNAKKRIMNISSGAARKPIGSWSAYCASKAGLDMFTRTVAVEQEQAEYPCELVSVAPGIIDTGMQEEIRSTDSDDFKRLDDFKNYKENNLLAQPSEVASKLIKYLMSDEFTSGELLDIRNL
jgi:benzil reductase ((S)-benzoin forming)